MVEMSPVETLRAAAAKLRELAKDASPGPWQVVDHNEGEDPPRPLWGVTNEAYHNPPADDDAPWLGVEIHVGDRADSEWIALVHPGVAKPLAELLGRAAESRAAAESAVARVNGGSLIGDESPVTVEQIEERAAPAALRVARLLLRVPDGR